MVLVSIIIPVYNTEMYLRRCIESLLSQTLSDIEIIAIDDGSTDGSGEILDSYQRQYADKIQVYHQENAGISAARNRGISLAEGKYIAFIDSDDSIEPQFCQVLIEKIESDELDMVICDFFEISPNERKRKIMPEAKECTVFEKPHLLFDINTSPWNKLYRKEFLVKNEISFPRGIKYEDAVFLHEIMAKHAKIGCVREALVNYFIHSESESTVIKKNVFDIFKILDIIRRAYSAAASDEYNKIQGYLEYFIINRITVYNLQQIYQQEVGIASVFIDSGFKYLDSNFPKWRKNIYFNQNNNLIKRIIKKHKLITKLTVRLSKILTYRGE